MKTNKKIASLILILLFLSSLLITFPASDCHSGSTVPIPIKKVVYIPPDPVIDDGEPGDDPVFNWQLNSSSFLRSNDNVALTKKTANKANSQKIKTRCELLLMYLLNMILDLK